MVKRTGKRYSIKVISEAEKGEYISSRDAEMDLRAEQAVKAAIEKAKICKKPIAKYDKVSKRAYLEYSDGVRRYVE